MQEYTQNYQRAGGKREFSRLLLGRGGRGQRSTERLSEHVVFAQHNLASDRSFNEFNVMLCRNVLIYFGRDAPAARARALLRQPRPLRRARARAEGDDPLHALEHRYEELDAREKLYRRVA